jgi:hypothetical protein
MCKLTAETDPTESLHYLLHSQLTKIGLMAPDSVAKGRLTF